MRNIVKCPSCGKPAIRYNIDGIVCAHCGRGNSKLIDVKPEIPKGKIKVAPQKQEFFKLPEDLAQNQMNLF